MKNYKSLNLKFRFLFYILVITLICAFVVILFEKSQLAKINTFEECSAKGYPILDTYLEQCRVPDGRTFFREIRSEEITVTGEVVCLPHKDQSGPQTLECAYGLKSEDGTYYALSDPEFQYLSSTPTGEQLTVVGKFSPAVDSNYADIGTIEISEVIR